MTDKVQKIKEWIGKEQDGLMDAQGNFEYPEHEGAYNILCNLDAYIDSLQEEPVSEDLKEFEVEYIEREKDNIVCVYDRHAGLVDGAKWQKQQMMKDAIEAEIINWASVFTSIKVIEPERAEAMIKEKFDIGDKVKLIIVKED